MNLRQAIASDVEIIARWLANSDNAKWLDFDEVEKLGAVSLKVMLRKPSNLIYLFADDGIKEHLGLVALTSIHARNRTGIFWTLLGNRQYARTGLTSYAAYRFLELAFADLKLQSVYSWSVETNVSGQRFAEKLGFRYYGRQRKCHFVDGMLLDRLWYDMLPGELTKPVPRPSHV